MDFAYARLRRFPDVEAPNLQAWDATDELLVQRALGSGATGAEIAVIGDAYGAITLSLVATGLTGIRVHQDLMTGRRALARNAAALGLESENPDELDAARRAGQRNAGAGADDPGSPAPFAPCELDASLLSGARLVLLQLPKALAELEEIADAVARWAAPDVVLVAGGRVKHMTLAQNEVLGRRFARVQAERAVRKSRLVVASGPLPVPAEPPFPVRQGHRLPFAALTLVAHGGVFAGTRLDIGTRVLLEVLAEVSSARPRRDGGDRSGRLVVDLGCGTGALAAAYALAHPDACVIATDRSAAAAASARETMIANGIADRVTVMHDDAASDLPAAVADVVLLNPPFHLGSSIHTGAAVRLFEAAARLLRTGGELWTVYNSALAYRAELGRLVGPTEQLRRTSKFTVTRSIRR